MSVNRRTMLLVLCLVFCIAGICAAQDKPARRLDVPYVPTHPLVVKTMLEMAKVGPDDIVYDLGCGDGRIVVAAVKDFGAKKGVGIDLDPRRIKECNDNAQNAGVTDRTTFILGDIFKADFREATVVTMYLLPSVNMRLRPTVFQQLRPGTRIVSHAFDMEEWQPDETVNHERGNVLYRWVIPAPVGGIWTWSVPVQGKPTRLSLKLEQEFQVLKGEISVEGAAASPLKSVQINGTDITVEAEVPIGGQKAIVRCTGKADGDRIAGTQTWQGGPLAGTQPWAAQREPVDVVGTWQPKIEAGGPAVPPGKLVVARGADGMLSAQYVTDAGAKDIQHLYVWGASVRFDVPLDGTVAELRGFIQGKSISGRAKLADSTQESGWTAARE